ncbi:hypothetical protein AOX56_11610 [Aeromonas sobria]|uniref:Cadherin domain-containing protein n=1 Tax=Aeromonas sobria TaxID=646 RepID=A0A2N3J4J4_AERSO|nr:hypothetical protein AOX56_11610 [Aeromonas sobria]
MQGVVLGEVTEDLGVDAYGALTVTGHPSSDLQWYVASRQGVFGTLDIDQQGQWHYQLENSSSKVQSLVAGQSMAESFVVLVADHFGVTHMTRLQIRVNGSNDLPVMAVVTPLDTHEGGLAVHGQLIATDLDAGDQLIFSAAHPVAGFVLHDDGQYVFDPSSPVYDHLKSGEQQILDIPVAVTDRLGAQDTRILRIILTGSNDVPALQAEVRSAQENMPPLHGQLIGTDPDRGDTLVYSTTLLVPGFSLHTDGSYGFDPGHASYQHLAAGQTRDVVIPITVTDSVGASSTQNLTIKLTGSNDGATIAGVSSGSTSEDNTQAVTGQLTITDMDDGEAYFVAQSGVVGTYGSFTMNEQGQWRYQLDNRKPDVQSLKTGDQVTDSFTVTSADGTTQQVTVTVTGKDDGAVIAGTDTGSVTEDQTTTLNTSGQLTITDPDAGQDHFIAQTSAAGNYGHFSLSEDGQWSYSADSSQAAIQQLKAGASLTDSFTVTSADGTAHTVTVTLTGSNDAPVLQAKSQSVTEDGTALHGHMVATDVDLGDSQTFSLTHAVDGFTLNADGSYRFDPSVAAYQHLAAGQTQTLAIPVTVTDCAGASSTQSLTITLTGTNDGATIGGADTGSTSEDSTQATTGQLTVTDTDDGEAHFVAQTGTAGSYGSFSLNENGQWTYQLDNSKAEVQALKSGESLSDSFTVSSADGTTQQVTVSIAGQDDSAVIGGISSAATAEDNSAVLGGNLTVSDADAGQAHFVEQPATAGSYGHFTLLSNGRWTYQLDNNKPEVQALKSGDSVTEHFTVSTSDGTTQQVTVTITGKDDGAVIRGTDTGSVREDQAATVQTHGQLSVSDPDAGQEYFTAQTNTAGSYGTFSIDAAGQWSYSADSSQAAIQQLKAGASLTDSFTVTSADGTAHTVTVTLTGSNDAPVLQAQSQAVREDGAHLYGQLVASDIDVGDSLQCSVGTPVAGFTLNADGSYSFDPANAAYQHLAQGQTQTLTIPIAVTDSAGATSTANLTITVTGSNDGAVIGGRFTNSVTEDSLVSTGGMLSAGGQLTVVDPDAGEDVFVTQSGVSGAGHFGSFSIDSTGHWNYSADNTLAAIQQLKAGETLTDHFTVETADGTQQVVTITINGAEDKPVLQAQTQSVTEDGSLFRGQLVATDVDAGDTQRFSVAHPVAGFVLNRDGSFTFNPVHAAYQHLAAGQTQDVVIPITVIDSGGGTSTENLTITVAGTNDAPDIHSTRASARMIYAGASGTTISGQLRVEDSDDGDTQTWSVSGGGQGQFGHLDFDEQTGRWTYQLDKTDADTQALKAGEQCQEVFQITVTDDRGASSSTVLRVMVIGTNDAPSLSAHSHTVTEDGAQLHDQMVASDVDHGDSQTFSLAQAVDGFTLNADGSYSFDPAHGSYQHLAAGQTQTLTIPITVTDSAGASSTANLTITLTGTNDGATIGGVSTGTASEDSTLLTTGQLTIADADDGEAHFVAQPHIQGLHGSFSLSEDGQWSYSADSSQAAIQQLKAGDSLSEHFTVHSADGTAHTVTVTLQGTNDAPVLQAQYQSVTEDGSLLQGRMVASDVDHGDTQTFSVAQAVDGFTLNADGSYSFDPSNAAYQHLTAGQTQDLVIPVTATDSAGASHTQNLTITITGTNDVAVIGGVFTGAVTEDQAVQSGQLQASGQLTITDADSGENHFIPQTDVLGSYGLGRFSLDAQGHWSYSADNSQKAIQQLAAGATLNDSFTVQGADGAQHTVTVTLTGTNDAPQFHLQVAPDYHPELESNDVLPLIISNIGFTRVAQYLDIQQILQGQAPIGAYANACVTVSLGGLALIGPDGQVAQVFAPGQEFKLQALVDWQQQGPGHEFRVFGPKGTVGLDISFHDAGDPNHITGPQGQASLYVNQVNIWPPFHAWQASTSTATDSGLLTATEGSAALNGQFHASDIDVGDTLSYSLGQPVDGFTLNADGSYSFDPAHPSYQHLAAGQSETLSIPITVTDSAGASSTQTLTILLRGANDAATFGGVETGATQEDRPDALSGQLTVADVDDGEAHFIVQRGTAGSYGQFSLDENGLWHYQLDNSKPEVQALRDGQSVTDSFTVRSADGTAHTVNISIAGKNDAAVITGEDHQTLTEDQNLSGSQLIAQGQLHASTPDAGGDQFTPLADLAGKFGHLSLSADGSWVYKADNNSPAVQALHAGQSATESFTVHSVDGTAHTLSLSIQGADEPRHDIWSSIVSTIKSNWAPYNLIGHAIDAGDVGALGSMRLAFNSGNPSVVDANGHVLASGSSLGAFGHDISIGQVVDLLKSHPGARLVLDGNVGGSSGFYLHDSGDVMELHFRGLSHYNQANSPMGQVPIDGLPTPLSAAATVPDVSDSLTISVTDISVDHAGQLQTSGQLSISDADAGENHFNAQKDVAGTYGSFSIDASGHWVYSVDNGQAVVQNLQAGAQLTDSFMVTSADGTSHVVSVAVYGKNDAPVLFAQSQSVSEDGAQLSGQMHASDVDAGDTLSFRIDQPVAGFTLNADGSYSFDPSNAAYQHLADGQTETLVIPVFVTDHMGANSVQDLTITVTGASDGAVISGVATGTVTEDLTLSACGQLAITDADDGQAHFVAQTATAGRYGSLTIGEDGQWQYQLDNSKPEVQALQSTATDTFTVHSADGSSHNITVTIQGQRDSVVIGGVDVGVVKEDASSVTGGHLVATGESAEFVPVSSLRTTLGQFSMDADGAWTYTLDSSRADTQALKTCETTTDTVSITHTDGTTHTITITVMGTNDAPVLAAQTQAVTEDGSQLSGRMVATDADAGETKAFSMANAVDGFTLNADGSYSFDPAHASYQHLAAGQTQDLVIPITVTDSTGLASTQNLTITVTGANDGPQVVHATAATAADLGAVNEDTPRVFTEAELLLAVGASDVDSTDSLHIVAGSLTSAHGTFTGDAAHGFTFTPAANFSGQGVDLQFSVTDGSATREAHVQLDITPVADAPLRVTAPTITTDFDSISLPGVGWTQTDPSPTGWHTDESSGVEIGQERLYGGSGNNQILSLTASWGSNIYRELPTQAGEAVHLGFDLSARPGFAVTPLEVLWEGKVIDTITPVAGSYSMLHHDYDLLANGSNSRLELRASGQGEARVLIDNIQIGPPEHVVLGDHDTLLKPYLGFQLADTDGSETLSYGIHGLPVGFTLTDGTHSAIVSSAGQVIETAGWNQDTLAVRASQGFQGTVSIQVTAHAEEGSNHQTANAADLTLELRLVPVSHAAVISGENAITLTEDQHVDAQGFLEHFGQLNVSDPDAGEAKFVAQNAMNTQYGRYTIGGDGYWLYETDNKLPAIQQLKTGESLTDSFTVHSIDGTPQTITVTILGQDDAPTFVPQTQAARVDSPDVYMQIGVQLLSSEHREFQFMGEVLLANTDPRNYIDAEMSFTNTGVALRAPDGSLSRVYHAEGGMTTVPVMDLRGWHNKGQGYDVVLVDATGMPINVFPHDAGDPDKMSGFNQYVTGFSGPFNAAVVLYPDMQAASSGGAVQSSAFVPAIAPVLYDAAHVLEDNGQQISGFIEVQDADKGQSSMQAMTDHHAAHGIFSIDVNGDWVYKLDTSRPDVQALKDGETLLETITVHSADGTPHEVNITIHGQNDGAVITGVDTGQLVEDQSVSAAGTLEAYGQLTVSDVDAGEAVFVAQNAVATKFGHFSIDASGAWRYEVDNNKAEVQALKPGGTPGETGNVAQTLAQVLSQSSEAGFHAVGEALAHGQMGAVAGVLDLSIQGAAIVLTGPAGSTPVVYAMDAQGRSTVGVDELLSWMHQGSGYEVHLQGVQTDVQAFVHDRGDAASLHGLPLSGVAELNDPAGAAQHLALQWHTAPVPGGLSEVVTVASADGTTHQITLNIQGTAENAVISGVDSGSVSEDAQVSSAGLIEAHGQLAIQDPDSGQAAFTALHDVAGKFGHLTLEASGHWSYTADNNSAALNALNKGQSAIETFVVKSVDGTAHTINVTVNGADEKPDLWPEIARNLMAQGGWDTRGYHVIAERMAARDVAGLSDVVMNVFDGKPTVVDAAGHVLHTFDQGTKFFGYRVPMDELCQQLKAHPGAMLVMQGSVGGSASYFFHNAGDEGMLRFEGAYLNQPANHLLGSVPINGLPQANAGGASHGNTVAQLAGADSGSVLADGDAQLQTQGHMTVLDADGGQAHFTAQQAVHGQYGQFSIDAQGSWHYQADGHQSALQRLAAGKSLSDSFSVTSADGTTHTVTVQLFGTRVATAAVIAGADSGSVTEDASAAVASGQLSIVDPDAGEAHFMAQANVSAQHGHFSLQDNGAWTYTLDNKDAAVQALKAGESFTEHLTVSSVDGTTHVLTVTVQGSNDAPVLQAQSQSVTEDGSLLRGQMAAQDADHGDALRFSTPNAVGGFTLNADGSYSFDPSHHDYQSLGAGQTRDIAIPITVTDSAGATATQMLNVHITGRNDSTFIYGVDSGHVQAGVHPETSGDLHASDDDAGQSGFLAGTVKGSFGSLSIDAQGHWSYRVDGNDPFVMHLLPSSHINEQLTVHSVDGTAHDIEIEVSGPPGGGQLSAPADSVNVQHVALPQVWGAVQGQPVAGHDVFAGILAAVRAGGYQYQGLADELDKGSLAAVGNMDLSITGVHAQVVDKFGHLVQSISPTAENAATLHMSDLLLWHAQGHSIIATSDSGFDSVRMWLHNTGEIHHISVYLPDGTGFDGWADQWTFGELPLNTPPAPAPAPAFDDPRVDLSDPTSGDVAHMNASGTTLAGQHDLQRLIPGLSDMSLKGADSDLQGSSSDHQIGSAPHVADYWQFADLSGVAQGDNSDAHPFAEQVSGYLDAAGIHVEGLVQVMPPMPPLEALINEQVNGINDEHHMTLQDESVTGSETAEPLPAPEDLGHQHHG